MSDPERPNKVSDRFQEKSQDLADLLGLPSDQPESIHPPTRLVDPSPDTLELWMDHPEKHPRVMDSLRMMKNALTRLKHETGGNFFLFTGPNRRIGVSSLTFNLALVMARDLLDRRILIVDGHMAHPALHTYFPVTPSPGLLNFILDGLTLDMVAAPSRMPNLDLVTLGEPENSASSPFDLVRFGQFIEETRARYDLVLMDSGPGLSANQTRVISPQVDGVVIVVEADQTRWEVLGELKRLLESDGAKVVGGILNKRRFVIPKWLYRFI